MAFEHLFSGSAVDSVGPGGAIALPPFIRRVMEADPGTGRITIGAHERDPCLVAWETERAPALLAEIERRRLRDEAIGAPAEDHHGRARLAFGFVEDGAIRDGRLIIPPMMRRKGRIADRALFIGTGSGFEIWSPELVRASADPALREIAEYRLGLSAGEDDIDEGGAR